MKIPMQWIADYAPIPVDAKAYEARMIMTGTGVEGVETLGADIENVVVGRVLSVRDHENSDHLHVCAVDVGEKSDHPLQIVCGAPNVAAGQLVPVALTGARLPGGVTIKKGKLRGVESEGMLCSSVELGVPVELYPSVGEAGLLVFQEEYPLGADVKPILGIAGTVVDFEILANRPDCLCVWGVARETAAALGTRFTLPEITVREHADGDEISNHVGVTVEEPALCPRYAARVIKNVRIAPSPMWMRAYLHAAGMRAINNIVDITNFVMLETGHPMHAFDLAKVRGAKIAVRKAHAGEGLRTLDGREHALAGHELLICDADGPTGLAGIMGGEESEITGETRTVMFECASFDRAVTRVASRGLGVRTESSGRFEKGVSTATVATALARACQLVNLLDAGDIVPGVIDLYPHPVRNAPIAASVRRMQRRMGVDVPAEEMQAILEKLFFTVTLAGDTLTATAPDFRSDVEGEADLSEEILRYAGYGRIPSTPLRGETAGGGKNAAMRLREQAARLLQGMGCYEMMTYSFVSRKQLEKLALPADDPRLSPVLLRNPLGEDTACMRPLLAPCMLSVLAANMNRGNDAARLYETAAVFDAAHTTPEGLPTETPMLCIGAYGEGEDFYTLRGMVEALLAHLGVRAQLTPGGERYHHPGRSATFFAQGATVATLGEVHPDVADAFELSARAYLAEVNLAALAALAAPMGEVKPLPRTPAVARDLALVMPEEQPVGPVLAEMTRAGGKLLEKASLFDVYRGAQVGAGNKSAAFSLLFRADDRTLTEQEVAAAMEKIQNACAERFNAVIRS